MKDEYPPLPVGQMPRDWDKHLSLLIKVKYTKLDIATIKDNCRHRQFEKPYEETKFLVADLEFGGFGAMIARRKLALQLGLYFDRCVILRNNRYVYDDPYKPLSRFSLEDIKNEPQVAMDFSQQEDKVVRFDFNNYWNDKTILAQYHEKTVGDLDFRLFSGVLLNLLELKDEYAAFVQQKDDAIGISSCAGPLLGVHIRRGDKEMDTPYISIERYATEIKDILGRTGGFEIFLCSDDSRVVDQLSDALKDVRILYDNEETRYDSKTNNLSYVTSSKQKKMEESMTGIKVIELLSRCNHVLGQSNVQFAKLAGCKLMDRVGDTNVMTLIDPISNQKCDWEDFSLCLK